MRKTKRTNKFNHDERIGKVEVHLTEEDLLEGWHFCTEFDYLLTQGEDPEQVIGEPCSYCGFKYIKEVGQ